MSRSALMSSSEFSISIARDEELDEVTALVNSGFRGDSSRAGWTTEADFLGGQRTDPALLRAELAATPGAVVLTMRDAPRGELLGCVWLDPEESDVWHLGMLTVRPDLQSRQLGRTLLAEAESYAAAHGARRMRLTVINVRDTLSAWYERRGYARTGKTKPFPYGDERFGVPQREDLHFEVFEKELEETHQGVD
jgi:ribosomal protein S18 acetylase RimI-like enzyme